MTEDTSLREKALRDGWDALTEFKRSALAARQAFDHVVGDQHQPKISKHGARNLAHLRKVFLEAKEKFPDFADTLAWLLWWSIKDFDRLAFLEADRSEAKDRRIEALEADKAELKKQLAAERKPDFFWDYNDPECSYDSPDEAIAQADMGSVVRLFTGKSLPQIWATTRVLTVDENGDWDDHEVAVFDNEADAKRCWPESLAAARAALSGKEGQS